jgi:hypothetical protein
LFIVIFQSIDYWFPFRNLSSHLTKLEGVGYVAIEKEFVDKKPRMTVSLIPAGRDAFRE